MAPQRTLHPLAIIISAIALLMLIITAGASVFEAITFGHTFTIFGIYHLVTNALIALAALVLGAALVLRRPIFPIAFILALLLALSFTAFGKLAGYVVPAICFDGVEDIVNRNIGFYVIYAILFIPYLQGAKGPKETFARMSEEPEPAA